MPNSYPSRIVRLDDFRSDDSSRSTTSHRGNSGSFASSTANSTFRAQPKWELEVNSRLKYLMDLPAGWDGHGAHKLDFHAAMFGVRLLQHLLPPNAKAPQLSPLCYGGLQFEWFSKHCQFEIEIEGPYRVRAWLNNLLAREETEEVFDYDFSGLKRMMDETLHLTKPNADAATAA